MNFYRKNNLKIVIFLLVKFGVLIILFSLFKWVYLRKITPDYVHKRGKTILFTSETIEWRRIFDLDRNEYILGDQFFNTTLNSLSKRKIYSIFGTYRFSYHLKDFFVFYAKRNAQKFTFLPLEFFMDFASFFTFLQEESLKIETQQSVRLKFYSYIFAESCENLLKIIDPDVILVEEEYGFFEKQLIVAGKKQNIPTIALQHGTLNLTSQGYIHSDPNDQKFLPDITCLYGEADKEILLNHSIYTSEQLIVTGSPRYDIIYHADEIYSREKFCTDNHIPQNHSIILWTTQSHGMTDEENIRQLDLVFGACDMIPDSALVIKQHPGEKKRHYRLIQSYCRRHSCNSLILPKDSDTFEALFASDLVITFHSTTGREAVAFKKPVVVLDPQDRGGYCGEGVGVLVSSIQEAEQVICRLIKDDEELAINREKYITQYFYALDGKSTERVVRVIEEMMSDDL